MRRLRARATLCDLLAVVLNLEAHTVVISFLSLFVTFFFLFPPPLSSPFCLRLFGKIKKMQEKGLGFTVLRV